ncbi:MAG: hypothetical protein WDN03_16585 [Rhizomicrobium sp.]
MMPSRLTYAWLYSLLKLRSMTATPLAAAWRRLALARSSGAARRERLAEEAWWRGDGAAAVRYWDGLARDEPRRAAWPLKLSRAAKERGDLAAAERILLDASGRGIDDKAIELGLLRYARLLHRSNAAVDDALEIVADPKASSAKVFYSAFYLMAENRLERARDGFGRVLDDARLGPLARGHLAAIDLLARARAGGRADVPGWLSAAQSSIVVLEPSSDTTVVAFSPPEGAFGLSVNALHAMLSSAGVNAIYLFDSRQLYHLGGSDRFGPGYAAMLGGVRAMLAAMGTRRLIVMGASASGYTALLAALDLKADGALVFSPLTTIVPAAPLGATRSAHILARLRQEALPMLKNLRPLLQARQSCPRIEIYYSASNARDRLHAGNVAGVRGVTLHAIGAHQRHDCLTEMAFRGYRDLLSGFAEP